MATLPRGFLYCGGAAATAGREPRGNDAGALPEPTSVNRGLAWLVTKPPSRRLTLGVTLAAAVIGLAIGTPVKPARAATAFYVDCGRLGPGNGSRLHPWASLNAVRAHGPFAPGDRLLFRRGTTCRGRLAPAGSGAPRAAITIAGWGDGAPPVIDAGTFFDQAIRLTDQSYWNIVGVTAAGGRHESILVTGTRSGRSAHRHPIRHIHLFDVGATGARGPPGDAAIRIEQGKHLGVRNDLGADDVLIDGATVWRVRDADGIFVSGGHVAIRNSVVHDVGGTGIWVGYGHDVVMERNLVHDVGISPRSAGVIGIWEWRCARCLVQDNEVYHVHVGNREDGGTFDIDYGSVDNTVQYNYGHDADGYCVSVFGANNYGYPRVVTTNAVIRYNVCSTTGLGPAHDRRFTPEGSIFLETWKRGALDGVQVYNNTIVVAAGAHPAYEEVTDTGESASVRFVGRRPNLFVNNAIVSATPLLAIVSRLSGMRFDHNLWYTPGKPPRQARVDWHGRLLVGFQAWRTASGAETHGLFANPLLGDAGYHDAGRPTWQMTPLPHSPLIDAGEDVCRIAAGCARPRVDFLGHPIPQRAGFDVGAIEAPHAATPRGRRVRAPTIVAFLTLHGRGARDSRGLAVQLRSLRDRLGKDVRIKAVAVGASSRAVMRAHADWRLGAVSLAADLHGALGRRMHTRSLPTILLLGVDGHLLQRLDGLPHPAALAAAIERSGA
jgi:hypothetical protein